MKCWHFFFLSLLFATCSWADFSGTHALLHPLFPGINQPYLIEVEGEWPSDCHPGEQKPVISDYTGDTVLIEFETIIDHVTCNNVPTPYRILADMSGVVGSVAGDFSEINIVMRFDGAELNQTTMLVPCSTCLPPPPWNLNPESGLYESSGLEKQGLLLARQNERMAVYPLIYDESGSSEWIFAGGGIIEDVYFADLYELTGGQCLGCPPAAGATQMNVAGKVSMLMDSEGLVQMKVNDGLFVPYEQSDFGYGSFDIGGSSNHSIPDLSGRWAFVEDGSASPQGTPEIDTVLPLVFDIRMESVEPGHSIIAPSPSGQVKYTIRDKAGNETVKLRCAREEIAANPEMTCIVTNIGDFEGERLYEVRAPSIERLNLTWVGAIVSDVSPAFRTAVRVD